MKKLKILKRNRINHALESIFDYPLTIIEAPMGYGKTTAVKNFLTSKRNPVLWLSFLAPEDTVTFFWDRLANQIGKLDEAIGQKLKSLGFPSDASQVAYFLSILNDMDYEENTVLVIDDFHLVKSLQIGQLLAHIVKEELHNLHIVVITRDTTNLDFAELIAKGICHIISQQTISFTDDETRDYCSMMGFMPTESDLAKICEYTDGWISLIYLILLALEKGIPVGMNNAIDELVEKVIYNAYDEHIRQFLLKLSVMDSFTAKQALFVSQEISSDEYLKRLCRENAFITYDESARAYKIHNVLLDFLRIKQVVNMELRELYRRVGEWHFQHKAYIPAYEYLYRAGETERILSHLNDEGTVTNAHAEFEGYMAMFKDAPRELLQKYPNAYLQYISLLLLSGDAGVSLDGVT
ncbi:MAG: LuxR family transcriptional regulator, partial [Desulfotomaculaceae bacterium]|nr:LuxR family transcriptional regulator [Desulfotomaculaceae bacterium]